MLATLAVTVIVFRPFASVFTVRQKRLFLSTADADAYFHAFFTFMYLMSYFVVFSQSFLPSFIKLTHCLLQMSSDLDTGITWLAG